MTNRLIRVSHYVGLSGIGGVQRNFVEYLNYALEADEYLKHKVYTLGSVDSEYDLQIDANNIINPWVLIDLIIDIASKNKIVHFYNNLTSYKVALLLLFVPSKNLIFHERGSAWNISKKHSFILKFIAWKSNLIIANSKATKTLLEKKFNISRKKIKVLHNGISFSDYKNNKKAPFSNLDGCFQIGFLGRFDSPKGIHVLIKSMQKLKSSNIKLIIAGDGPLNNEIKELSKNLNNIKLIGRIKNPYKFFEKISLLVVPSIREPLGNVCIEAGYSKTPVLASNIDGIPEIITNFISGELLNPSKPLTDIKSQNVLAYPEYVVNPTDGELMIPLEIDPIELADKILELSINPKKLSKYSENLHLHVSKNFSISRYTEKLHEIYNNLLINNNK